MPKEKIITESAKQKIAHAALGLFAKSGYEATSMREISKEAGIVPGTLFHYFPAKADLLRHIIRAGFDQIKESLVPYRENANPVKALNDHLDRSIELVKANKDFWRMVHSLRMQNEVIAELNPEIMEINGFIMDTLEKNFARLGHEQPTLSATFLFSSFDGIVGHYLMLGEFYPADAMIQILKDKLISTNK
jgi:AcrR family transcriptional regulator